MGLDDWTAWLKRWRKKNRNPAAAPSAHSDLLEIFMALEKLKEMDERHRAASNDELNG
jgi:hypothetical protein